MSLDSYFSIHVYLRILCKIHAAGSIAQQSYTSQDPLQDPYLRIHVSVSLNLTDSPQNSHLRIHILVSLYFGILCTIHVSQFISQYLCISRMLGNFHIFGFMFQHLRIWISSESCRLAQFESSGPAESAGFIYQDIFGGGANKKIIYIVWRTRINQCVIPNSLEYFCTGPKLFMLCVAEPSRTSSAICPATLRNLVSFLHQKPPELQKLSAPEPSRISSALCTGTLQNLSCYLHRNLRNLVYSLNRNRPEPHQPSATSSAFCIATLQEPSRTCSGTRGSSCAGSHQNCSGIKTPWHVVPLEKKQIVYVSFPTEGAGKNHKKSV